MQRLAIMTALAAALVGFGLWLGHAAGSAPATAPAPAITAPARAPVTSRAPHVAPGIAPDLAADLHDRDPKVRRAAVAELAHAGANDPATLLDASRDGNLGVAVTATEGLGALYRDGRLEARELAVRVTDHQLAEKVRVTAMNELGTTASRDAATLFEDLLAHGDATERRSAAILFQHQDASAAVPALITALGDADEVVRGNALASLRHFARGRDFGTDAAAWQRWWQSRQG
jgi:hypothetical protein